MLTLTYAFGFKQILIEKKIQYFLYAIMHTPSLIQSESKYMIFYFWGSALRNITIMAFCLMLNVHCLWHFLCLQYIVANVIRILNSSRESQEYSENPLLQEDAR